MFDSIFKEGAVVLSTLNGKTAIMTIGAALIVGLLTSVVYYLVSDKNTVSSNLMVTLVVVPAIVSVMIYLIGSNVATAFTLAGVSTLVRFRSVPGDSKDITFIFMTLCSGLAIGMGYVTYSFAFSAIFLAVVLIVSILASKMVKSESKMLKIVIPENLNYEDAFADLFKQYTRNVRLERVKTINLGTLFELTYIIEIKSGINEKELIDGLRTRNGNLNIILGLAETRADRL
ncbi:MAG: DUF4956 domain-containing protein [Lachnospiraceae bacterium]|nr:DUF4956 domain-containing protein [Lachnospiraceae bacterium]